MQASALISEVAFQTAVIGLARLCGWRVAHFHDSRRQVGGKAGGKLVGDSDAAGFPDLVMVRVGVKDTDELLFVELKSAKGRVSSPQALWGDDLSLVAEYHLWRPSDWPEIQKRLS